MSATPDPSSDRNPLAASAFAPEVSRRSLLRRAAAVGLLATPAVGLISGCVAGGDDGPNDTGGERTDDNPLGVDGSAPLEVVIFDGGYGDDYATNLHQPIYQRLYPDAQIKHSATQSIATTLQPRFAAGDPPDFVNNSGTEFMDFGVLVQDGQLRDLNELYDAPSLDIEGKTVRETLVPGTVEQGMYNGTPYVLNYVFTVYALWYSGKLFQDNGWTAPTDWNGFTALLENIKSTGVTPYGYAGANAAYYQYLVILSTAAKIGGADVLKNIDNLEDGAWTTDAVREAAARWAEVGANFMDKSHEGLIHTDVQLQQNQGRLAIYPSGSWLEAEQKESTPDDFSYAAMPIPSVTGSDALPATALFATAGEPYVVASRGKNPQGGLEYMRVMLSMEGARGFVEMKGSLTSVVGSSEGVQLPPGLQSASAALDAAGATFNYRFPDWYQQLDQELRDATNALMFGRQGADQFVERMQRKADEIKADPSIDKFTR